MDLLKLHPDLFRLKKDFNRQNAFPREKEYKVECGLDDKNYRRCQA